MHQRIALIVLCCLAVFGSACSAASPENGIIIYKPSIPAGIMATSIFITSGTNLVTTGTVTATTGTFQTLRATTGTIQFLRSTSATIQRLFATTASLPTIINVNTINGLPYPPTFTTSTVVTTATAVSHRLILGNGFHGTPSTYNGSQTVTANADWSTATANATFVTQHTAQSGLNGDKTWTGNQTFKTTTAAGNNVTFAGNGLTVIAQISATDPFWSGQLQAFAATGLAVPLQTFARSFDGTTDSPITFASYTSAGLQRAAISKAGKFATSSTLEVNGGGPAAGSVLTSTDNNGNTVWAAQLTTTSLDGRYITRNTAQTGNSGAKTWTGAHTFTPASAFVSAITASQTGSVAAVSFTSSGSFPALFVNNTGGGAAITAQGIGSGFAITAQSGSVNFGVESGNGTVSTSGTLRVRGGSPGSGKVLTATDLNGNSTWQTPTGGGSITSGTLSATSPLTVTAGRQVLGGATTMAMPVATSSANGYLSSTDWSTFNGKENVLTFLYPLVRTVNTIKGTTASATTPGFLSAADWSTFNSKQSALTLPLSIANGGTNNSTAYTAGSAIYSDGTKLTQDNSGFFYDATNKRLGVGAASPPSTIYGFSNTTGVDATIQAKNSFSGRSATLTLDAKPDGAGAGDVELKFYENGALKGRFLQYNPGAGTQSDMYFENRSASGHIYFNVNTSTNAIACNPDGSTVISGTLNANAGINAGGGIDLGSSIINAPSEIDFYAGAFIFDDGSGNLTLGGTNTIISTGSPSTGYIGYTTDGSGTFGWEDPTTANGGTPAVSPGAGAGTGGTAVLTTGSRDGSMRITVVTGTLPTLAGTIFTVTYSNAATNFSTVTAPIPVGTNAFAVANLTRSVSSTTGFTLNDITTPLTAATTYVWDFQVRKN